MSACICEFGKEGTRCPNEAAAVIGSRRYGSAFRLKYCLQCLLCRFTAVRMKTTCKHDVRAQLETPRLPKPSTTDCVCDMGGHDCPNQFAPTPVDGPPYVGLCAECLIDRPAILARYHASGNMADYHSCNHDRPTSDDLDTRARRRVSST